MSECHTGKTTALAVEHRIPAALSCGQMQAHLAERLAALSRKGAGQEHEATLFLNLVYGYYPGFRDNGEPKIIHPLSVAYHVSRIFEHAEREGHTISAQDQRDAIAAAFFHDVLEDRHVKRSELEHLIGKRAACLVFHVSKTYIDEKTGQRVEKTPAQNMDDVLSDPLARIVKLCDREHNLSTIVVVGKDGKNLSVYPESRLARREVEAMAAVLRVGPTHYPRSLLYCITLAQFGVASALNRLAVDLDRTHNWKNVLDDERHLQHGGGVLAWTPATVWAGIAARYEKDDGAQPDNTTATTAPLALRLRSLFAKKPVSNHPHPHTAPKGTPPAFWRRVALRAGGE